MRHIWSVFCRTALTDKDSNAVSLLECIDAITAGFKGEEPPPDIPVNSTLVTFWRRSDPNGPERGRVRILLEGPDGKPIREVPYQVDLSEHPSGRVTVGILGLPYRGDGVYEFVVSLEDPETGAPREVARLPVPVKVEHEPGGEDAT